MHDSGSSGGTSSSSGQRVTIIQCVPAVILYPSLLTPEIITAKDPIQLLILGKGENITAHNINWQLKISEGLDELKGYYNRPLFTCRPELCIGVDFIGEIGADILGTFSCFNGRLDFRALKKFKDKGYTKLFKVRVFNILEAEGLHNLFWYHHTSGSFQATVPTSGTGGEGWEQSYHYLNTTEDGKVIPNDLQDKIIWEVLEEMHGADTKLAHGGKYCFQIGGDDVDLEAPNLANPIQSFHPVTWHKERTVFNFAQISDLHISSRQYYFAKSKARVIEYAVNPGTGVEEQDTAQSPEIGPMVCSCSKAVKALLDQIGSDANSHVLLLAGDLIDYIRNVYQKEPFPADPTIKQVWTKLAVDDGDAYKQHYHEFVDYISIYSLLISFMKQYRKPAFVVRGNHDCYVEPYGISPRARLGALEIKRANEGIPADHNLTIYEAILAFGETYHEIKDTSFGFKENKLKRLPWFYNVLTPFADFLAKLPKQCLLGLTWGEDEDVIGLPGDTGQGFWGHLPRAEEAMTDDQLELAKKALTLPTKKFLFTHFTFVSYVEQIPLAKDEEGNVQYDTLWSAGDHDMGTFHLNRKPMYETYLGERKFDCALSGHSHRRGVYSITRVDLRGKNSVKTRFMDFTEFGQKNWPRKPTVVVTDSAGPLPRYNKYGYFDGWGSDRAGGGIVTCDPQGSPSKFDVVAVGAAPRFAVALDYWDVIAGDKTWPIPNVEVIAKFETKRFKIKDENAGTVRYQFQFWLNKDLDGHNLHKLVDIMEVYLYAFATDGKWKKVQLHYDGSSSTWNINGADDARTFRRYIATQSERAVFCSVKFSPKKLSLKRYDFNSNWNFEIQIDFSRSGRFLGIFGSPTEKKYIVERNRKRSEFPDFGWREKLAKKLSGALPKFA